DWRPGTPGSVVRTSRAWPRRGRPSLRPARPPGTSACRECGRSAAWAVPFARQSLGVHRLEELLVVLRLTQLVEHELDGVLRAHRIGDAAQDVSLLQPLLGRDQLFLAGAGLDDVDRREDAFVADLAVQHDLRVAGALELFENHLVHAAAGVDQAGGDDGQRAALLDVARRAEEALRLLQSIGVDAAGEHLAG